MGLRAHEYALAQPGLAPARRRLRRPAGVLGRRRRHQPSSQARALTRAARSLRDAVSCRGVEDRADREELAHLGQLRVDVVLLLGQLVEFLLHGRAALVGVGLDVGEDLLALVLGLGDDQLGLAVRVGDFLLGVGLGVAPCLLRLRGGVGGALLGVGRPPFGLLDQLAGGLLGVGEPLHLKPLRLRAAVGELDLEVGLGLGAQRLGLLEQELLAAADLVGLAAGGADDVVALPLGGGLDLGRLALGLGADARLLELGGGAQPGRVGLGGGPDLLRLALGLRRGGLGVLGDLPLRGEQQLLDASSAAGSGRGGGGGAQALGRRKPGRGRARGRAAAAGSTGRLLGQAAARSGRADRGRALVGRGAAAIRARGPRPAGVPARRAGTRRRDPANSSGAGPEARGSTAGARGGSLAVLPSRGRRRRVVRRGSWRMPKPARGAATRAGRALVTVRRHPTPFPIRYYLWYTAGHRGVEEPAPGWPRRVIRPDRIVGVNPRLVLPRLRRLAGEHKLFTGALAAGAAAAAARDARLPGRAVVRRGFLRLPRRRAAPAAEPVQVDRVLASSCGCCCRSTR